MNHSLDHPGPELPFHAPFHDNTWGRMATQVVRVAQVTGMCDHTRSQARGREGRHEGYMGVNDAVLLERHKVKGNASPKAATLILLVTVNGTPQHVHEN